MLKISENTFVFKAVKTNAKISIRMFFLYPLSKKRKGWSFKMFYKFNISNLSVFLIDC